MIVKRFSTNELAANCYVVHSVQAIVLIGGSPEVLRPAGTAAQRGCSCEHPAMRPHWRESLVRGADGRTGMDPPLGRPLFG